MSRVPVDDNPVDDPLNNLPVFSAVYSPASTSPLAPSPLPGVGYRRSDIELSIHNIAAGGLFNISAATIWLPPNPPSEDHAPSLPYSQEHWSLPLNEPAAYNLHGFPPIPPQLILWEGIVMQIKDA